MNIEKKTGKDKSKGKEREKVQDVAQPSVIPFYPFGRFLLPLLIPVPASSKPRKE